MSCLSAVGGLSYHGQLLSLAVQWGVAIEIERAIKAKAKF